MNWLDPTPRIAQALHSMEGTVREHRIWPDRPKASKVRKDNRTKEQQNARHKAYYWRHRERIAERRKTAYWARRKRT